MQDNAQRSSYGDKIEYLVVYIADQMFGIPVLQIQDVLGDQQVTPVPLAPSEVSGALNLRGRIVTAINARRRLGLPQDEDACVSSSEAKTKQNMSVVVELDGELYSLVIDRVGDVLALDNSTYEATPNTLDPVWREVSSGIHRLDENLMVVMDVSRFLDNSAH